MASLGSLLASCSATAPIPPAGKQFEPVANMRITNWNRQLEVLRLRSKKMPPRKGRKKRSVMAVENPSSCRSTAYSYHYIS